MPRTTRKRGARKREAIAQRVAERELRVIERELRAAQRIRNADAAARPQRKNST